MTQPDHAMNDQQQANLQTSTETVTKTATETLDARGLTCPLPLLKLKQALKKQLPNTAILLMADDVNSVKDITRFCELSQHTLLSVTETVTETAHEFHFLVQKTI